MQESLLLDQSALAAFVACPRRFQLRYLLQLPWPALPLDRTQSQAIERGRRFHRLVERHFLDLPVEAATIADAVVRAWWEQFSQGGPVLPNGRRWPEFRLTVPVDDAFLVGRLDLLILGEEDGRLTAHLYDWKTSRPRSLPELQADWQTRLYLALLAESGTALGHPGSTLAANDISLTYWYTADPENPRVLSYGTTAHEQNWVEIRALVSEIKAHMDKAQWPLTDDWRKCRQCTYQVFCGRQAAGQPIAEPAALDAETAVDLAEDALLIEPQMP